MFCHICGAQISEGARFCRNCGAKVVYEDSMDTPQRKQPFSVMNFQLDAILSKVGLDEVHTVKAIEEWAGIGSKEAEKLFEQVPALLKKAVTLEEAHKIREAFAKERAEVTFIDSKGHSVDIDQGEGCDQGKEKTWKDRFITTKEKFLKLSVFWRWFLLISGFVSCGAIVVFGLILLIQLLRLIFSSFIYIIIAVAVGYILYLTVFAEVITEFRYKREIKQLKLPDGMSVSMLLEALSGKFNYPYFKGAHYGSKGECVIEGKYSLYPVMFKQYNHIVLEHIPKENENNNRLIWLKTSKENYKTRRLVLLETMVIRDYINKFFNPTLPINTVRAMSLLKRAESQRKVVAIASAAKYILVVAVIAWYFISPGSLENRLINMVTPGVQVRSAYLSHYSDKVTVEKAFENFFDKCKWEVDNSGGYQEVIFTGVCRYDGERADVRIVFKITGEQFIVDSLDINGRRQSDFVLHSVLSAVYEDYEDYRGYGIW